MRNMFFTGLLALGATACVDQEGGGSGEGAAPEGYVRYETPPVDIAAGRSALHKTWVADAVDHDRDMIDIQGEQGSGGHHAVLLTTTEEQPVGTTRDWSEYDQLDTAFLGGIGGEGGEGLRLPEGAVFRVPAGRALVMQTHYQNASDQAIEGTSSYLDVKFAEPSDDHLVAGLFAHLTLDLNVPPGPSERELTCVVTRDVPMLMLVNHIHEWGLSIKTTLTVDGEERVLKDDQIWNSEWVTNPNYQRFTVEEPFIIPAGSTIKTHCNWNNTTGENLVYPEEMCIFTGYHSLGDTDVICKDGVFTSDA